MTLSRAGRVWTAAWPVLPVMALLPGLLLGGCVAAAVPIAAGAVFAGNASQKRHDRRARSQAESPSRAVASRTQTAAAEPRGARLVQGLAELPPPSGGAGGTGGYSALATYALAKVAERKPEGGGDSVVLAEDSRLQRPRFAPCGTLAPAVVIDLDPGGQAFDPTAPGAAAAGLAASLASLRAVGITVMWSSALGVDKAQAVYDRLRVSGLDPDGIDRLLLVRKADERKQTRRLAATRDWCVIALAGDRKGDFDELFDYLRDESYAVSLSFLDNAGWFLAPPPIPSPPTTSPTP